MKDAIVYSTSGGRMCPGCGRPVGENRGGTPEGRLRNSQCGVGMRAI